MTPLEMSVCVQRSVASAIAHVEEVSDEEVAARIQEEIGDVPQDMVRTVVAQFRALKVRAKKEFPRMRWGASGSLDDMKVARFAFEAAQENRWLDEVAVRSLLKDTWYYLVR